MGAHKQGTKKNFEDDRRFFAALIVMSFACFVFEAILRSYGLEEMPIRFALKSVGTVIALGILVSLAARYRADRYALYFIVIGTLLFALDRALEVDAVEQVSAELLGMSQQAFGRLVSGTVQKGSIFAVVLSLIYMIITTVKGREKALKEAEESQANLEGLRASEARFRVMFEEMPSAACHVSSHGEHIMVNRQLCELLGYSEAELLAMPLKAVIDSKDWEAHQEAVDSIVHRERTSASYQVRYRHKNEFLIWVENTVKWVADEHLGADHLIVMSVDITDRKRRLAELSESVSLLEATLESTNDGILVVDRNARIIRYNKRFLEMWRIPESVMTTMSDQATISFVVDQLTQPDEFLNRIKELYRDIESESFDVLAFKDGRHFERYSKPQYVDGEPIGRVWSFRDVTQAHHSQSEQARLQGQLQEAQKSEALGSLATGVAHEFNNHLSCIVANTEVALTLSADSGELKDCLRDVLDACGRSKAVVERIMKFSRRQEPQVVPLSLSHIVDNAIELIRPGLPTTIEIEAETDLDLPVVMGDEMQLHQILLNLCSNAANALQGGPGRILIECRLSVLESSQTIGEVELPVGNYLCLRVSDNGRGMAEDVAAQAFEPLFTTQEIGEGSGLGLSVVRGIVKAHRGAIHLESQLGEGTTVELFLPASYIQIASPLESGTDAAVGQGERVLLLDDDLAVGKSVAKLLSQLNYSVKVVNRSSEALALLENGDARFHVLVTDLTMPEMDGIELTRRVRRLRPELPVVLLTGFGDPRINDEAKQTGVAVVLRKPVSSASLSWALGDALSRLGNTSSPVKYVE